MPSSSDDFILAIITSDVNGRNTTNRNTTKNSSPSYQPTESIHRRPPLSPKLFFLNSPLYHKKPSPYLTLPSPAWDRSKTQIHSPTSCRTRFAYFLLISEMSASSGGAPKLEGWIAIVSWGTFMSHQFGIFGLQEKNLDDRELEHDI